MLASACGSRRRLAVTLLTVMRTQRKSPARRCSRSTGLSNESVLAAPNCARNSNMRRSGGGGVH